MMNKKLKSCTFFTGFFLAMFVTGLSQAAFMEGCYVRLSGGLNGLRTQHYKVQMPDAPTGTTVTLRPGSGWGSGFAVGAQRQHYRLEAALDYLSNKVKNGTANVAGGSSFSNNVFPLSVSGRVTATPLLINGYYDFISKLPWTPYVGIGLGVASIGVHASAVDPLTSVVASVQDHSNEFAYQGIVGAYWQINPSTKASVDYRYLRTETATFNALDSSFYGSNQGIVKNRYIGGRIVAALAYYFD